MDDLIQWLLDSPEPWTRYRTQVDLLDQPEESPAVQAKRAQMITHPQVLALIAESITWGENPFKRHNDAGYPIYKLSTLADFGLRSSDPGMAPVIQSVLDHQSQPGAFQSLVNIPLSFGGTGEDQWTWMICDSPTLLYFLLAMGLGEEERVQRAVNHLASLVENNGYRCIVDPALGKFRGPGAKSDPCPIANVYALKALSQAAGMVDSPAAQTAAEMLLKHWASSPSQKHYLFGVGSDFRKLKYPYVWYDILHVGEVLSRFPFTRSDPRFHTLAAAVLNQVGPDGRFTASSMYQSWKGWSFADKKKPSPWLTFLVLRMMKRLGEKVLAQ
jgi:hypothetical protein